jgi:predicted molibdopterin-dependent oxidoreductase YjgC
LKQVADPEDDPETTARVIEAAKQAAAVELPELHVWKPDASSPELPARDAYALRLVAGRTLYDHGRITSKTPVLAALQEVAALTVNPVDAARIGVDAGGQVKITSARGSQVVAILPDARVPVGAAHYNFTADGAGPATLIDVSAPVTDLRVESRP